MINDKSQGEIAKHLRSDQLLNLLVKEFLKLVNIWRSYEQNGNCFMRPIRTAVSSSKTLMSPDKLNNLCISDINCY